MSRKKMPPATQGVNTACTRCGKWSSETGGMPRIPRDSNTSPTAPETMIPASTRYFFKSMLWEFFEALRFGGSGFLLLRCFVRLRLRELHARRTQLEEGLGFAV